MFPLRDWIDAGLFPIYSSDAPVIEDARPMTGIATAVSRADADGNIWGAEQAVTLDEALAMCTAWAARAAGAEGERGRISPGLLADFTVFDVDLSQVPVSDLAEVEPIATIVGGHFAWRKGS